MAAEMLLTSQRMTPAVLLDHGFAFAHPDVDSALRWALERSR
jgi:NAD dependent epimerase/dehydratase family enzyme